MYSGRLDRVGTLTRQGKSHICIYFFFCFNRWLVSFWDNHYFSLTRYKKSGRKCYSFNTQVSVFIDVWWLHAAIPCVYVWSYYINLQPVGIGRVQNSMQACIQLFLEAFTLLLDNVFSVQTKPNKMLHLNISCSEE